MRGCITSNNTSGRTLAPMMGGGAAEEVRYTAFLLDEDSRLALLGWASEVDSSLALPPDWTTRADHLTIWHRPTPERMAGYDAVMQEVEAAMPRLRAQARIVWGTPDPYFRYGELQALREQLPEARVSEIPGGGHFPTEDAPAAFVETLRSFLSV